MAAANENQCARCGIKAVPGQVFLMLPYLLSIAALVAIARSADYPKALMLPYFKGQR